MVATVLTVYGIETLGLVVDLYHCSIQVATVLTVYGIETPLLRHTATNSSTKLQQYLPFTVLKLYFLLF